VVAKYSVVRKLGAFHLMPSAIELSAARIARRSVSISALKGCCNAAMNSSTAPLVSWALMNPVASMQAW
jgi:hypothetical protein